MPDERQRSAADAVDGSRGYGRSVLATPPAAPPWIVIRPITPADRERLRDGFDQLSDASRHHRFLTGIAALTDDQLSYLTDLDHRDHEALAAIDPQTGDGIGIARYVRLKADPRSAELAVTVADAWQGRGVGTALVEELVRYARRAGIRRLEALVLQDNRRMIGLLESIGPVHDVEASHGVLQVSVDLHEETQA